MSGASPKRIEPEVVDIDERGWLPRHCRGDEAAFDQLLRAYRGLVMSFLWRWGVDPGQREDLFQEIFLRVHRYAARYRPSQALRPWIVTIALNTVRNHRRDQGRKARFLARFRDEVTEPRKVRHNPGADHMFEHDATVQWLESRIRDLPRSQRDALVLSTLKGMRMKDIARALGLPENTVKTQLRRARLALAESLARRERPEESHEPL